MTVNRICIFWIIGHHPFVQIKQCQEVHEFLHNNVPFRFRVSTSPEPDNRSWTATDRGWRQEKRDLLGLFNSNSKAALILMGVEQRQGQVQMHQDREWAISWFDTDSNDRSEKSPQSRILIFCALFGWLLTPWFMAQSFHYKSQIKELSSEEFAIICEISWSFGWICKKIGLCLPNT